MRAEERLAEIEATYDESVRRMVPFSLDGAMVRLILYQQNIQPSAETSLRAVMHIILGEKHPE